tara:strand:+ start:1968 stop:2900 length:933 start_codon:yes stop_codon:yes gene_type:complete
MTSKYNRAIVYDLETGGLSSTYNSITEIAMVAVDLESLEIIEETSILLKTRVDLKWCNTVSPIKDAKIIYNNLGTKDIETNIKTLMFKGQKITLKNLEPLVEQIDAFYKVIEENDFDWILDSNHIEELLKSEFCDIMEIFLSHCYNPQALDVTGISMKLIDEEGLPHDEVYAKIKEMIARHTVGNSKPIIVGHNIGSLPRRIIKGKELGPDGFDNPFMEKLFNHYKDDWFACVNEDIVDTLKWARMKWTELPNFTLGTCANEVGLTLKEAHRALPDTIANAKFYIKMMQHLRGQGSEKTTYKRQKFNFQI